MKIEPATDLDLAAFYGRFGFSTPWHGVIIKHGAMISSIGGIVETSPGEWFAFLDIAKRDRKPWLFRRVLKGLMEAVANGATGIYAHCDDSIPRAHEFLLRLGFKDTGEVSEEGKRIYRCQV